MQHLTENELRKDEEIDVGNKPVSSSKELSLMERRFKSKSANRGKQDECGPLYLDDLDPKEVDFVDSNILKFPLRCCTVLVPVESYRQRHTGPRLSRKSSLI